MTKQINVLIVEDEPLIASSLEAALKQISETNGLIDFKIKSTNNCDSANEAIKRAIRKNPFDLVLLDIGIPSSKDKQLLSGEDIGEELRKTFPEIKIIVFTSYTTNYRLNNILKSLNPEGFLLKSDVDFTKLIDAINAVIYDGPFYSKAILQLMRRHISNDFVLDQLDRQLIYQISRGAQIKDIAEVIPLSKSAIEYRKRNIKQLFDVEHGNDRDLLIKAEEHGYI
ncbi:response regulator [uncultured Psychroserpens sp.]|uniref:response regulator n=1 Tax=uncultured Psychroserpens sp. TaxID=255436 RepID=UPI00261A187F|nr:response regulator transcription factor [uncultured Psychroserpens sp.]